MGKQMYEFDIDLSTIDPLPLPSKCYHEDGEVIVHPPPLWPARQLPQLLHAHSVLGGGAAEGLAVGADEVTLR